MRPRPIALRLRAARPCRRALAAPLALIAALHAAPAGAAAFLPGQVDPDPPTGEVQPPPPGASEPLAAGNGIRWELAPWRWRGRVAVDTRWTSAGEQRRSTQLVTSGDVDFASYVWQPWFIQVRTGVGLVLARSQSRGGDAPSSSDSVVDFNGRVQVSVFPSSRFPFEFRADVSDSRSGGDNLTTDFRTYRVAFSQAYQPLKSNSSYALNLDHSRVSSRSNNLGDSLTVLRASASNTWATQSIESSLSYSLNARSDTDERSRFLNLSARHSWNPVGALSAETLASWNDSRLRAAAGPAARELVSGILQVSTVASWRPRAGDWLYSESAPFTATATARLSEASQRNGDQEARARAFNLAAGAIKELSRHWRLNGGFTYSQVESGGGRGGGSIYSANGALSYTPEALNFASWRYSPSANLGLGLNDAPDGQRRTVSLQASHGLGRSWSLAPTQTLAVMMAQSAGALRETPSDQQATGISHSVGLFWQDSGGNGSQTYASVSLADSRSRAQATGTYQFVNAQLSRRSQLSRFESWSANFTLQASRADIEQLDPFTGELRRQDDGWQRYYSGSLSYQSQRAFGVPRLRMTWLLTANTQQLERRSAGDIDAPLERSSESLEGRLEYLVGRLDLRLTARMARLERRNVAAIAFRAQRRF